MVIAGLIISAIALVMLLRRATRSERFGGLILASVGVGALAAPFVLAALGVDFVDPRNLIGSLVPLIVAAGVGLGCAGAGRLGIAAAGAAAVLCLVVLAAVYESSQMQRPDWRGAAAAMGPPSGPRVLVVARNGNEPIAYYRGAREFRSPQLLGRARQRDRRARHPGGHGHTAGHGVSAGVEAKTGPLLHAVALPGDAANAWSRRARPEGS